MTVILIKTAQVILALGILIVVHEFGHFFFAKIFGIKVDKFFLFFDAWGAKLFSTRSRWFTKIFPKAAKWETEYGIGWLPLGGYCKIAGMIDESMDTEHLKTEPQPWEFRSKPAWKRLFVMAGGVLFNFIFAILMYSAILNIWGESYLPNKGNKIYADTLAKEMGFHTGDEIIRQLLSYAQKIGLKNTHFVNVHGLDEENHYSTAYDLAIMAKVAGKTKIIDANV